MKFVARAMVVLLLVMITIDLVQGTYDRLIPNVGALFAWLIVNLQDRTIELVKQTAAIRDSRIKILDEYIKLLRKG